MKVLVFLIGLAILLGALSYSVWPKTYGKVYVGQVGGDNERDYIYLLNQINNLHYGDRLNLYLTTPGGSMFWLGPLVEAIQDKNVHIYVDYYAYSAGAILLCNIPKDKIHVANKARIGYHRVATVMPNGQELPTSESDIQYTKQVTYVCVNRGILTQKEYETILNSKRGEDIVVLSGRELKHRLGIK